MSSRERRTHCNAPPPNCDWSHISHKVASFVLTETQNLQVPRDPLHHAHRPLHASYPPEEEIQEFWLEAAQEALLKEIQLQPIVKKAKNVIIFLGDGMGVSTLTAARILKGQQEGLEGGEQETLSFEEFPHVALSRTYCVDR